MAKPRRGGIVYALGHPSVGPVKIGFTAKKNAAGRLQNARRMTGQRELIIHQEWPHLHAYMVERFVHIYLADFHQGSEWYDLNPDQAREGIERCLELAWHITRDPAILMDPFERSGIDREIAEEFVKSRPRRQAPLNPISLPGQVAMRVRQRQLHEALRRRERNAKRAAQKPTEQIAA